MEKIKNLRLFIAIRPPEKAIYQILEIQKNFPKNPNIKLEDIKKLHLTLNFLGNINGENLLIVEGKIHQIIDKIKQFKIFFDPQISFFPNVKAPRVVVIDISKNKELAILKEKIDQSLKIKEKRGFRPHLTIARIKGKIRKKDLDQIASIDFHLPSFIVEDIVLFESKLTKEGSKYEIKRRFKLQG